MAVLLFNMCNSNPQAREACMKDWDVWLYPELQKGWDLYRGKETPYQNEREQLEDYK